MAQALKIATNIGQSRWQLFSQRSSSIPTPLLVVLVAWLSLIFLSFGMFAPGNFTVIATLIVCALVIYSSIFLILELDRPFEGVIRISSEPLRNALAQLGK